MDHITTAPDPVQALSDEIVNRALVAKDYTPLFSLFCDGLLRIGVPVFRVHIAMATLHPMAEGVSLTWRRGQDVQVNLHEHGSGSRADWQGSPLKAMLDERKFTTRFRKQDLPSAASQFPLFADLLPEGLSDYTAFAIGFSEADDVFEAKDGLIASFCCDATDGFSDTDIAIIGRLIPRLGLVAKLANRERLLINVLEAYLGPDAGRHVRDGQIALGSGDIIHAVIWFCDLRNSVMLAEKLGHKGFITLLNDYFSALAGSVTECGGEVLRFVGDAALAIFPIYDDAASQQDAKEKAMRSVHMAIKNAAILNAERKAKGLDMFEFGIGLHVGEIMYGNIGIPQRVEYSVTGPAANQAARIESLCKILGERVLVSEAFREGLDGDWHDLGMKDLHGSGEMRLFAPRS